MFLLYWILLCLMATLVVTPYKHVQYSHWSYIDFILVSNTDLGELVGPGDYATGVIEIQPIGVDGSKVKVKTPFNTETGTFGASGRLSHTTKCIPKCVSLLLSWLSGQRILLRLCLVSKALLPGQDRKC